MSVKSIFVIHHISGFDYEGESKTIVATRNTTLDKIQEEIDFLNNNVDGVVLPSNQGMWKYFTFEEITITDNLFSNVSFSSSTDVSLNKKGLRNNIKNNFDRCYNHYVSHTHLNTTKTLNKYLSECFRPNMIKGLSFNELLDLAEEMFISGEIKSNITEIKLAINSDIIKKEKELENKIISKFDDYFASYDSSKNTIFEHLKKSFKSEIDEGHSFIKLIDIAEKGFRDSLVKTDVISLRKGMEQDLLQDKLSSKFLVIKKKK